MIYMYCLDKNLKMNSKENNIHRYIGDWWFPVTRMVPCVLINFVFSKYQITEISFLFNCIFSKTLYSSSYGTRRCSAADCCQSVQSRVEMLVEDWSVLGKQSFILRLPLLLIFYGMMVIVDSVLFCLNLFPPLAKWKADSSMWVPKISFENFPVYEIQKPHCYQIKLFNLAVLLALDKFCFHLVCLHCFV